jgi:hypothetical protein
MVVVISFICHGSITGKSRQIRNSQNKPWDICKQGATQRPRDLTALTLLSAHSCSLISAVWVKVGTFSVLQTELYCVLTSHRLLLPVWEEDAVPICGRFQSTQELRRATGWQPALTGLFKHFEILHLF